LIGLLAFVVFSCALYDVLRRSEHEATFLPATVLGAGLLSVAIKLVGFLLGFVWFVAASVVLLRPGYALGRGALAQRTAQ
jgi:hypothetical protein